MSEKIVCGEGRDSYEVTISSYPNRRQKLRRAFNARGKTGEDLVSAIVTAGSVSSIYRIKEGRFNDGPNGEPALQSFSNSWFLSEDRHCKDGQTTDIISFHDNGQVASLRRYENNQLHDAANGEAAIESYDRNGGLTKVGRTTDTMPGLRPQEEIESITKISDPSLADLFRCTEIKYLDAKEIAAYAAKFNKALPGQTQETPAAETKSKVSGARNIVSGLKRRL